MSINPYNDCLKNTSQALGRKFTKKESEDINNTLSSLIRRAQKAGPQDPATFVMQAIDEITTRNKIAAARKKADTYKNFMARQEQFGYITTVWDDNPGEGMEAYWEEVLTNRPGAKNSVFNHIEAAQEGDVGTYDTRLLDKDLQDVAAKGLMDREISQAEWELNSEAGLTSKLDPRAVEIAKINTMTWEYLRVAHNKAAPGAYIGKAENYTGRRSYDPDKIANAGGVGRLTEENFQVWYKDMSDRIDWEKSLEDVLPEDREEVMRKIFSERSIGVDLSLNGGSSGGRTGFSNLGKKFAHERVFQFKDSNAEFEIMQKYGVGETKYERMIRAIMSMSKDRAIMQRAGTTPIQNFESVKNMLVQRYHDAGNFKLEEQVKKTYDKLKWRTFPYITGEISRPGAHSFAQWMKAFRSNVNMAFLGKMAIGNLGDVLAAASTYKHTHGLTNSDFITGIVKGLGSLAKGPLTKADKRRMAQGGIMFRGMGSPLLHFSSSGDVEAHIATGGNAVTRAVNKIPRKIARLEQRVMRWFLSSFTSDRLKLNSVMMSGNEYAELAKVSFEKLELGKQRTFQHYGMDKNDWDVIRKGIPEVDPDGIKFLSPETILAQPSENFDLIPGVKEQISEINAKFEGETAVKYIERIRDEARDRLYNNYRVMFASVAHAFTHTPRMVDQSLLTFGTNANTVGGELLRQLTAFKTFMVPMFRNYFGRELHGHYPNRLSTPQALMEVLKGNRPEAAYGLVSYAAMMIASGIAINTLYDLAKGIMVEAPETSWDYLRLINQGILRSGGLGVLGDFLHAQANPGVGKTAAEILAGPVVGAASDIINLAGKAARGEDATSEAIKLAFTYTPGLNAVHSAFYTQWALKYLIMYRMQEWANPGYLTRMEYNAKTYRDQEFLVPPSSVIPYGG